MREARAVLTDGEGASFVGAIEVDEPAAGEVLVALKASGVCHTDWDIMRRRKDVIVMGHEGAGVVEAVGEGVEDLAPGDRVALNWAIPCGACFQCVRGNQHLCERKPPVHAGNTRHEGEAIIRAFQLGTMATLALVRREAAVKIDVEVPFASAAIVGCGVMTGVGSVLNAARVEPGASVVVLGTGGVGLNVIQGARLSSATTIIGVDVSEERLELARRFGATHTIRAEKDDAGLLRAAEQVRGMTEGRGADYAFECTAVPELGAAPLAMTRNGGTAVQVSGIEQPISFDMELFEWDKNYINPLYGQCCPSRDFPRLFSLYERGALMLDEMVTKTYPMEALPEAFDDMHAGRIAKGVLLIDN